MTTRTTAYLVTEPGMTPLRPGQKLSEQELDDAEERYGPSAFAVEPAVDVLGDWLVAPSAKVETSSAVMRLLFLEALVAGAGSRSASSVGRETEPDGATLASLGDRAIARARRLGRLHDLGAPEIVLRNERRMLRATARAMHAVAAETPPSAATAA